MKFQDDVSFPNITVAKFQCPKFTKRAKTKKYHMIVLAHLSRRLIGELIVYAGIRRPSVVRRLSTFSNDISPEADSFHITHIYHLFLFRSDKNSGCYSNL